MKSCQREWIEESFQGMNSESFSEDETPDARSFHDQSVKVAAEVVESHNTYERHQLLSTLNVDAGSPVL